MAAARVSARRAWRRRVASANIKSLASVSFLERGDLVTVSHSLHVDGGIVGAYIVGNVGMLVFVSLFFLADRILVGRRQ